MPQRQFSTASIWGAVSCQCIVSDFNGHDVQVYKRSFWTESFVQWSGQGSYLATVHRQGVAIWGGQSWPRITRFSHPGVRSPPLIMNFGHEMVQRFLVVLTNITLLCAQLVLLLWSPF